MLAIFRTVSSTVRTTPSTAPPERPDKLALRTGRGQASRGGLAPNDESPSGGPWRTSGDLATSERRGDQKRRLAVNRRKVDSRLAPFIRLVPNDGTERRAASYNIQFTPKEVE